jgi:hypothetical protein
MDESDLMRRWMISMVDLFFVIATMYHGREQNISKNHERGRAARSD